MKIVFFNRFFFPNTSATSQIVSDLAFDVAGRGDEVHVVTSRSPAQPHAEQIRGVNIHRVATAITGPHNLATRAIRYLAYYLAARRWAREHVAGGDIVILKTDPPMLSAAVGFLAKRKGAKVVAWLQDVFPEIARAYGIPLMGGISGAALRHARNRSLAIADRVVAISDRMGRQLLDMGSIRRERMEVISNWADGQAIRPVEREENLLRRRWDLGEAFVVGYSGNLGRVHEFDTLLSAAELLKDDKTIRFLIIGHGPRLAEVRTSAELRNLTNIRFEPHQDRETLAESLGAADVHLSILAPQFEGLVHPSKLFGIMAAGRPTIFIGDVEGETASILRITGSGSSVNSGDAEGLVRAITRLRDDQTECLRMGSAARRAFDERYSMSIALGQWRRLLDGLKA